MNGDVELPSWAEDWDAERKALLSMPLAWATSDVEEQDQYIRDLEEHRRLYGKIDKEHLEECRRTLIDYRQLLAQYHKEPNANSEQVQAIWNHAEQLVARWDVDLTVQAHPVNWARAIQDGRVSGLNVLDVASGRHLVRLVPEPRMEQDQGVFIQVKPETLRGDWENRQTIYFPAGELPGGAEGQLLYDQLRKGGSSEEQAMETVEDFFTPR